MSPGEPLPEYVTEDRFRFPWFVLWLIMLALFFAGIVFALGQYLNAQERLAVLTIPHTPEWVRVQQFPVAGEEHSVYVVTADWVLTSEADAEAVRAWLEGE
jgi:hypothetical protein